jgi:protease IV
LIIAGVFNTRRRTNASTISLFVRIVTKLLQLASATNNVGSCDFVASNWLAAYPYLKTGLYSSNAGRRLTPGQESVSIKLLMSNERLIDRLIGSEVTGDAKRRRVGWFIILTVFVLASILGTISQSLRPTPKTSPFMSLFDSGYREKHVEGFGSDKIVIIRVEGAIIDGQLPGFSPGIVSVDALTAQLDKARTDETVKAVILAINSPGGAVTASDTIYHKILELKAADKKVVALMKDTAASGGYYIAVAADKIVANRTTITGSIGAIFQTINTEGLEDKIGVRLITLKAGEYKDLMNPSRPITATERQLVQDILNTAHAQFKEAVAAGRGFDQATLDEISQGQIFSGERAQQLGLVDELGSLPEAIALATVLAELEFLQVVEYKPTFPTGFYDLLFSSYGFNSLGRLGEIPLFARLPQGQYYLWTP